MTEVRFRLAIPSNEFLRYYEGSARGVVVTLESGRRLQFPASNLRPFLTHAGVYGEFLLRFNAQYKLVSLERLGD